LHFSEIEPRIHWGNACARVCILEGMLPSDYTCPRCKCQACYALHRKGFDWVMSFFGLRPARCLTCNKRFYARYSMATDPQDQIGDVSQDRSDAGRVSQKSPSGRNQTPGINSDRGSNKAA
jgi:hypothetical protein